MAEQKRGFRNRLSRFFKKKSSQNVGADAPAPQGAQMLSTYVPQQYVPAQAHLAVPPAHGGAPGPSASPSSGPAQNASRAAPHAASQATSPQPTGPAQAQDASGGDEGTPEFRIHINKNFWPAFDPGEDTLRTGTGSLFYDFAGGEYGQWARGANFGPGFFGKTMFFSDRVMEDTSYTIPSRLFDLVQRRVVTASEVGRVRYATVSHVWGQTTSISGAEYGVDWNIPISSEQKLESIFEAARIVTGERYIWLDVICMDQRRRNELEIERMESYFKNATGCLVWLDNAFGEGSWPEVLGAIKSINQFFNQDEYSIPTVSVQSMFGSDNPSLFERNFTPTESFKWVKTLQTIEKAPWFKRVWTLQEGVIPDNLFFITPEKYMISGGTMFQTVMLCQQIAELFLDLGSMPGFAITHELQKSEIFKIYKLRQLYRAEELSYFHVTQSIRSRSCSVEQDRMFAMTGLLRGMAPAIDYSQNVDMLFSQLYKTRMNSGDFSSCLFLGSQTLMPNKDTSMGFIGPGGEKQPETHSIVMSDSYLRMNGVGYDWVTRVGKVFVSPLEGPLEEWGKTFPEFLDMGIEMHIALATAWGMPTTTIKIGRPGSQADLVVGAWAAYGSMSGLASDKASAVLDAFGEEFKEEFWKLVPRGYLTWIKVMHYVQDRHDSALVILWTSASEVQLAVVTEPVEGNVMVVTPSSYKDHPGRGCLVCKHLPDGTARKIGIGLGSAVKASTIGNLLVTV